MRKARKNAKKKNSTLINAKNLFRGKPYIRNILGIIFVILGFLFLYKLPVIKSSESIQKKEPITASAEFKKNSKQPAVSRILISSAKIDLGVKPAKIIGGYWEISENSASHGEGSANPGTNGNIVVFAHAREGLFYNLKDVKRGDIIYIFTKDHWYRYKVGEIKKVYPNEIATVAPSKSEVLTLFTCSGFFDEKRLIVKAYPVR